MENGGRKNEPWNNLPEDSAVSPVAAQIIDSLLMHFTRLLVGPDKQQQAQLHTGSKWSLCP